MIILFDLGNVIVKPLSIEKLYERLEAKIPYDEFKYYWLNDQVMFDAHQGLVSDDYHVSKVLEFAKSNKTVSEFYDIYNEIFKGVYEDTIELAHKLREKKIPIGVLSNLREMDHTANKQNVDFEFFDYLFLSYKMKKLKPNEDIYEEVIKTCNVPANEIYFFDDLQENVEGARKSGINAYCTTGNEIKELFYKLKLI